MTNDLKTFDRLESEVRTYVRSFPAVFTRSLGANLYDECGRSYIDFLSGAGALNYGHNHPELKAKLIEYLEEDGLVHSLDLATTAKQRFLETFEALILKPRGMNYKVQFTGPTGANAVEAALKLARLTTGRTNVVAFANAFHGLSLGALAITSNARYRRAAGIPLHGSTFVPYDGHNGNSEDSLKLLRKVMLDSGKGPERPAAVIVETVQAEGGVNVATQEWLCGVEDICRAFGALFMIDDIQTGCGRTGTFFSFEQFGVSPDIITLSKSLSGYGLPFSIVLLKPELDRWKPGEHSGTFRGNNLAFVAATSAIELFWQNDALSQAVQAKSRLLKVGLQAIARRYPAAQASVRGRGLLLGLAFAVPGLARAVSRAAFERGLIVETSGAEAQVIKCLPPLLIEPSQLEAGLRILDESVATSVATIMATG